MTRPTTNLSEAERLMQEGKAYLEVGSWELAEARFRAAARTRPTSAALNNWALCRHMRGDQKGALAILKPLLEGDDLAPYSQALASLIHSALDECQEARTCLTRAVKDFEAGLAHPALRSGVVTSAWIEYTLTIKRAAAELGEYRLLLDLHDRWPGRDLALGGFLAGVAAFNLGKYERAARYWRRISDRTWRGATTGYARVADLVREGLVPPFTLETDHRLDMEKFKDLTQARELLRTRTAARVPVLAAVFASELKSPGMPLSVLISATGDWGVQLGHRVLQTSRTSLELKMAAARALTEQGILAPGEPVKVIHEGRTTEMTIRQVELRGPDGQLDQKVAQARQLRDAGQKDEAYALLAGMELEGVLYPPAMIMLANLRRGRGELAEARQTLEALAQAMPDDAVVLFNLAGLSLQEGKVAEARELMAKINPQGQPPEFLRLLQELKSYVAGNVASGPRPTPDVYRREVEERPISPDLALRAALKRIPVEWLNAAAAVHQVQKAPRRPQREQLVAEALQDAGNLGRVLGAERPEVRAALRYVLEKGGWCKLQLLTKRYGAMDGDGYFWGQKPPSSVIGRLCLLGLAFVGRVRVDGKAHKAAVIPTELRHLLATVLTGAIGSINTTAARLESEGPLEGAPPRLPRRTSTRP